eukprot:3885169-Amphidinium_carterae.1
MEVTEQLAGRLKGLSITELREPADVVVDFFHTMADAGRLRWLPWEELISKESETLHLRKDVHVVVDAHGVCKPPAMKAMDADLSSDLLIVLALERRGVALDISHVCPFEAHQCWVEELMDKRLSTPQPGFSQVRWHSCEKPIVLSFTSSPRSVPQRAS